MPETPTYEEKPLLLAIAQGVPQAFSRLFEQYKDRVYSFAMHYTGREDVSEELVQEVFMKVWLHRESLPRIERFEAWLFTICRNLSFNYLRKIAREQSFRSRLAGQGEITPHTADMLLLSKECDDLLKAAVDRLPPQQRLIYTLYREQFLQHEDIASRLGLAHTTVKSHLALAMRSIRTYVQAYTETVTLLVLWLLVC